MKRFVFAFLAASDAGTAKQVAGDRDPAPRPATAAADTATGRQAERGLLPARAQALPHVGQHRLCPMLVGN